MDVSRDTFEKSNNGTQNLLLFDSIQALHLKLDGFNSRCDIRHDEIDVKVARSGKLNRFISAGSGALSGFVAVIGSKFMGA